MNHLADDPFVPVTADECSDLNTLPRRFDAFATDVLHRFDTLTAQLLPLVKQLGERLSDVEHEQKKINSRLDALEATKKRKRK